MTVSSTLFVTWSRASAGNCSKLPPRDQSRAVVSPYRPRTMSSSAGKRKRRAELPDTSTLKKHEFLSLITSCWIPTTSPLAEVHSIVGIWRAWQSHLSRSTYRRSMPYLFNLWRSSKRPTNSIQNHLGILKTSNKTGASFWNQMGILSIITTSRKTEAERPGFS
ncbi:hypothetical protein BKA62DRAFT_26091 [Auriculariales sp. MPI-PUGE-AT-0066]|nr:hypothetical protein BKA62DRAFT_26091 [Auriculariales sp. MPI-PUGE-AT-0066]